MNNIKTNILIILFSILPISIVLSSGVSLINTVLLSSCLIFVYFSKKKVKIYDLKPVLLLIIFNLYLIFNSFNSIDIMLGIFRNFGFVRFILFFIIINYLFYIIKYDYSVFKPWLIVFSIFIIDVFFERLHGTNMIGYGGIDLPHGPRIVSFFKDEPIAGAYIYGFMFLIFGYIFLIYKNKNNLKKNILLMIFTLFLCAVLITGERSNTIKALFGFVVFIFFLDHIKTKIKLLLIFFLIFSFSLLISKTDFLKDRYFGQLINKLLIKEKRGEFIESSVYFKLYKSGFNVFKNYPLFGVGNKNYRVETCNEKRSDIYNYHCSTHPHQIYIEFISEHGILGTLICLSLLFYLIFKNLKIIINSKNFIQAGAFIYMITNFLPIIPSGSFFSDFNITFFMINFSLMYAVNKKTNIFETNIIQGR